MKKVPFLFLCVLFTPLVRGQVPAKVATDALVGTAAANTVIQNVTSAITDQAIAGAITKSTAESVALQSAMKSGMGSVAPQMPGGRITAGTTDSAPIVPVAQKPVFEMPKSTFKAPAARPQQTHITPKMNTFSRVMTKKQVEEIRPYLFQTWDTTPPESGDYYQVTKFDSDQLEAANAQYTQAMQAVKDLAKYVDTHIYYMGSAESARPEAEHFRRTLADITKTQGLVRQAFQYWGDLGSLQKANLYLTNVLNFYLTQSTGIHHPIGDKPAPFIERTDGHKFDFDEFNLHSEQDNPTFASTALNRVGNWFKSPEELRGAMPQNLRVAIIQNEHYIRPNLETINKKAGLNWTFEEFEDPEYFLTHASYEKYDLILTDLMLPNGGGRYLSRQLRGNNYEGSILAVSFYSDAGYDVFGDGIDGFITLAHDGPQTNWLWNRLNDYYSLKQNYGWKH